MKIDITSILGAVDNSPLKNEDKKPVTLGEIMKAALLNVDAANDEGAVKFTRWGLAMKIAAAEKTVELAADEVTLIKDLIGKGFSPIIVGPAWTILESLK